MVQKGGNGLTATWKQDTISKGYPNYILSFIEVSSCSNSKTFVKNILFLGLDFLGFVQIWGFSFKIT